MDLLLTPENPSMPTPKAPYVCDEIWDGGTFMTYPRRCGKMRTIPQHLRKGPLVSDEPFTELKHPTQREEIQRFYQIWLFFGLLAEFLGLNEQEDGTRLVDAASAERELANLQNACILIDGGQRYLTAVKALSLASDPFNLVKFHSNADFISRINHLKDCLVLTYMMTEAAHPTLDETIIVSIAALGELLAISSQNLIVALGPSVPSGIQVLPMFAATSKYLGPESETEARMLELGWCRSETGRIRSFYRSIYTMYYLSRLPRSPSQLNHSSCTGRLCNATQINLRTYKTRHVSQDCSCKDIEMDQKSLQEILASDSYPVLNLEKFGVDGETVDLLETYSPDMPYVALSHVWADGLGNPFRNSLPRCQMKRITSFITDLYNAVEMPSETPTNRTPYRLWIDTLLCPTDGQTKRVAIKKMADVYRNASHVLVLDSSLLLYSSEHVHPLELSLRVFGCCNWMRRLWTLQEGAISKSLYFQFADRAMRDIDLVRWLYQKSTKDARILSVCRDMILEMRVMRSFFPDAIPQDHRYLTAVIGPARLLELQQNLYFRSVSVPLDEPLCIATLLSLNVEEVALHEDSKSRMICLWTLIANKYGGVPSRIIFYGGSSIDEAGWRWAPRSLLSCELDDLRSYSKTCTLLMEEVSSDSQRHKGIPTSSGLRVQFPGALLQTQPRASGMPLHPWNGVKDTYEVNMVWARHNESGKWFYIVDIVEEETSSSSQSRSRNTHNDHTKASLHGAIDEGNCAFIFDDELPFCLLAKVLGEVKPTSTTSGHYNVRIIKKILFQQLDATWCVVANEMRKLADQVIQDDITTVFLKVINKDAGSREHYKAREGLQKHLQSVVLGACSSNPQFAQALKDALDPDPQEAWRILVDWFSHDIALLNFSKDNVWVFE